MAGRGLVRRGYQIFLIVGLGLEISTYCFPGLSWRHTYPGRCVPRFCLIYPGNVQLFVILSILCWAKGLFRIDIRMLIKESVERCPAHFEEARRFGLVAARLFQCG